MILWKTHAAVAQYGMVEMFVLVPRTLLESDGSQQKAASLGAIRDRVLCGELHVRAGRSDGWYVLTGDGDGKDSSDRDALPIVLDFASANPTYVLKRLFFASKNGRALPLASRDEPDQIEKDANIADALNIAWTPPFPSCAEGDQSEFVACEWLVYTGGWTLHRRRPLRKEPDNGTTASDSSVASNCNDDDDDDDDDDLSAIAEQTKEALDGAVLLVVSMERPAKAVDLQAAGGRFEHIERFAASGDAHALARLGWCYSTGAGVAQDEKKAVELYKLAADKGDSWGMVYFGLCEMGRIVDSNDDEMKSRAVDMYANGLKQVGFCSFFR